MQMIQRFLGVTIGALLTLLVLWVSTVAKPADLMPWYVAAVVIGAIASFLWPSLVGFWSGRRAKDRREETVEREVQRQLAEERAKQDDN
jgi:hypothetical protein